MADYRDQIIALAQVKPLLPNDVAKALNTNMLMASAMLSELSATKKLKVSRLKIGSSPLYFLPDKEEQLEKYLSSLNEKDRQTAEVLQKNKVLCDSEQDPLTRVSLRQISDFSRPIMVKENDKEELFWKWFLVSNEEAENKIQSMLHLSKVGEPQKERSSEQSKSIPSKLTEHEELKKTVVKESFATKITLFFEGAKMVVIDQKQVKRSREYEYVVQIPSAVGLLTYYCRAKNKKKITEADVSQAFVEGQLKKLPVLVVSDGELDKKAKFLLEQLRGVSFQRL